MDEWLAAVHKLTISTHKKKENEIWRKMYAAAESQIFIYVFSTLPCYLKENNHALLFIFIVDDNL